VVNIYTAILSRHALTPRVRRLAAPCAHLSGHRVILITCSIVTPYTVVGWTLAVVLLAYFSNIARLRQSSAPSAAAPRDRQPETITRWFCATTYISVLPTLTRSVQRVASN